VGANEYVSPDVEPSCASTLTCVPATTISLFIIGVLSLFSGVFFHVQENLPVLNVWVVDFDQTTQISTAIVGPTITETARGLTSFPGYHITFEVLPASTFGDAIAVRRGVYKQHAWGAITINSDASSRLQNAVATGNVSYDPTEACEVVYVSARDQTTLSSYIVPAIEEFQIRAQAAVGRAWSQELFSRPSLNTTALAAVPQAVSPAVGFTTVDLRPFGPPQVQPWVSVALIYLIIIAFFSYTFFMPTHTHFISELEGHRKVHFHHLVIWKYMSTLGAYFFMSLAYSLVPLMFQVPFSDPPASPVEAVAHANAYGRGSFPVFWTINFLGMCALGYACENVAMFIGQPWTALWLIFWVISNVATAFYPILLAPGIYQFGYAFPLHSVVEATRIVLFDLHSTIGRDLGILCAWWAVNTTLFPFAAWWLRHTVCKPRLKVKEDGERV
jgi:Protein of unknown function (DUF3533)